MNYDKESTYSIYEFAYKLYGSSLRNFLENEMPQFNIKNKGALGQIVEEFYFKHKPPNNTNPDFPKAYFEDETGEYLGLELKVTGVVKNIKKESTAKYQAKERLKLMSIDFNTLGDEIWETSSLLHKCRLMLIMFYLYDEQCKPIDLYFVLPPMLYKLESDLHIIKRDWEIIRDKVRANKSHEISEADTEFLGACTHGGSKLKDRFTSVYGIDELVPRRAFALKRSYMNSLINEENNSVTNLSSHIDEIDLADLFKGYLGQNVDAIATEIHHTGDRKKQKNYLSGLTLKILETKGLNKKLLDKAGIDIKTIRLIQSEKRRQKNTDFHLRLAESLSFRQFNPEEIINGEWEDSEFMSDIESRFLFVIYVENSAGDIFLKKINFWSMPYQDRRICKEVWNLTKAALIEFESSDEILKPSFPKISDDKIAHVRPKGRNRFDTVTLKSGKTIMKQSFWLNRNYLEKIILSL